MKWNVEDKYCYGTKTLRYGMECDQAHALLCGMKCMVQKMECKAEAYEGCKYWGGGGLWSMTKVLEALFMTCDNKSCE